MKGKSRMKVGGKSGDPGYRTPSVYRYRQHIKITKRRVSEYNKAK